MQNRCITAARGGNTHDQGNLNDWGILSRRIVRLCSDIFAYVRVCSGFGKNGDQWRAAAIPKRNTASFGSEFVCLWLLCNGLQWFYLPRLCFDLLRLWLYLPRPWLALARHAGKSSQAARFCGVGWCRPVSLGFARFFYGEARVGKDGGAAAGSPLVDRSKWAVKPRNAAYCRIIIL
jgi:hypothetical protein